LIQILTCSPPIRDLAARLLCIQSWHSSCWVVCHVRGGLLYMAQQMKRGTCPTRGRGFTPRVRGRCHPAVLHIPTTNSRFTRWPTGYGRTTGFDWQLLRRRCSPRLDLCDPPAQAGPKPRIRRQQQQQQQQQHRTAHDPETHTKASWRETFLGTSVLTHHLATKNYSFYKPTIH